VDDTGPYPRYGEVAVLSFDCQISTSNAVNPALIFYYHMYGQGMGSLYVDVFQNSTQSWTTEFSKTGQQHTSMSTSWSLGVVTLPKDPVVMVRFRGVRGGNYEGDIAFDSAGSYDALNECVRDQSRSIHHATNV